MRTLVLARWLGFCAAVAAFAACSGAGAPLAPSPSVQESVLRSHGAVSALLPKPHFSIDPNWLKRLTKGTQTLYSSQPKDGVVDIFALTGTQLPHKPIGKITFRSGQQPWGLAVDSDGNLYVSLVVPSDPSNSGSCVIDVFAAKSKQLKRTLSGCEKSPQSGPLTAYSDIAVDSNGVVYIVDLTQVPSVILVYGQGSLKPTSELTTGGGLYGVAVDGAGNVYTESENTGGSETLDEFPGGANTPVQLLTCQVFCGSEYLDAAGDLLVATNSSSCSPDTLNVYPPGQILPSREIPLGYGCLHAISVNQSNTAFFSISFNSDLKKVPLVEYAFPSGMNLGSLDKESYASVAISPRSALGTYSAPLCLHGCLYVTNNAGESIALFAPSADGNVAPVGSIAGSYTELNYPDSVVVGGGAVYAVNESHAGSVTSYPEATVGNITPTNVISGSATMFNSPIGSALDSSGYLYVANSFSNAITVFAPGATGNATPVRVIAGANTLLDGPSYLAVDASGDIYVVNAYDATILTFGPDANGNVAPVRTLSGSSTGLQSPFGIAFDSATSYIWVGDLVKDSLSAFPSTASGNTPPTAVISGTLTGICSPYGLLVSGGTLFVANNGCNEVLEFPTSASGNVAPSSLIGGGNTTLDSPSGVAIGSLPQSCAKGKRPHPAGGLKRCQNPAAPARVSL